MTGNATIQAGGGIIADGTGNAGGSGTGSWQVRLHALRLRRRRRRLWRLWSRGRRSLGLFGLWRQHLRFGDRADGPGQRWRRLLDRYATGGAGGGAIRLTVTGVLQVDGRISARGTAGSSPSAGGGSGGSIYLTVGTLAGSGVISANGGAGNALGGGGGGGRIAITYTSANAFSGLMSAYGGGGYAWGGAGTIYTKANSQSTGLVMVDNGGQAGTNTSWPSGGTLDLTVRSGATLSCRVLADDSPTCSSPPMAGCRWRVRKGPGRR